MLDTGKHGELGVGRGEEGQRWLGFRKERGFGVEGGEHRSGKEEVGGNRRSRRTEQFSSPWTTRPNQIDLCGEEAMRDEFHLIRREDVRRIEIQGGNVLQPRSMNKVF
ncbi:hypothetical protein AMTR_s00104p00120130 [Amborella trichopoda]|uniref:Uncharacterized protein n=1 Tax=Amborella trichopoda TaxID=13333 RepID=W1P0A4_AMBTC|nr:hypothetical protein AMTR_s00104p00120130 [Amborella trichopoda]